MISVSNLGKTFGRTVAVNGISFEVNRGEVLGFLGPNAAGKTTTMRMLTCYLTPDRGTATVAGFDIMEDSLEVRKRVGYLPESAPLYTDMDVEAYLKFIADVRGLTREESSRSIGRMIETCGLKSVVGRNIGELSKGFKQRVGVAQTLIHDPEILVLDEPTTGLDPSQIIEIRELIKEIGKERTVILSTHILPEVEATCSRVVIINEGELTASGTPEELNAVAGGEDLIHVSVRAGDAPVEEALGRITSVTSVARVGEGGEGYVRYVLKSKNGVDVGEQVYRAAVENGWTLNELRRETLSLEDIFLKLTTKEK
ncbi:MAG: ATP-binding cassette domain-containing protein [Candidatus Eisenbacteria bacterium]